MDIHFISFAFLYIFATAIPILSIIYLFIPAEGEQEKKTKKYYMLFLLIGILGTITGALVGLKFNYPSYTRDVSVVICLISAPGAAFTLGIILKDKLFSRVFNCLLLAAVLFIFFSFLLLGGRGLVGSFLRGGSTPIRYSVMFLGFYGFALLIEKRERIIGAAFLAISLSIALLGFNKWTLPLPLIMLTAFFLLYKPKNISRSKMYLRIALLSVIALLTLWGIAQTPLPDYLAQRQGYVDFHQFWRHRVVNPGNPSQVPYTNFEFPLRDSGRFEMWQNIIERTMDRPFTGIGIGARPFFHQNVGAHNVFIFLLGGFGFPLFTLAILTFCIFMYNFFILISYSYKSQIVFMAWLAYLLLAFNVGVSYEQHFNLLFAFMPLTVLFRMMRQNLLQENQTRTKSDISVKAEAKNRYL